MTAEFIYTALNVALALALDLVPGLKEKWDGLPEESKRWGWLLGSLTLPIGLWVLACEFAFNPGGFDFDCSPNGMATAVVMGIAAYYLSQGGHALAKYVVKRRS